MDSRYVSVSTSDTLSSTPTMKTVEDVDYSVLRAASSSCLNRITLEISEENKSVLRDSMKSWESSEKPEDFSYDANYFKMLDDINTMITYLKEIEKPKPQLYPILPELLKINCHILIAFTVSRLEMTFNSVTWLRLVELYTKYFHLQITDILYAVKVRLLHVTKKLPADYIVANLTDFYVSLCLKIKRYSLIECLAVDAFYCLKLKSLIAFKKILDIYPALLPTAERYESNRKILFYSLLDMSFHAVSKKSSYPVELQKMLREKYRYNWETQVNNQVSTTLFDMLENNYLIQLETAVIIFTKRTSWHHSNFYLLQRGFFPVIDKWLTGNNELSEEAIALSVRCLACVARSFPVPDATDKSAVKEINAVSNKLMSLVQHRNMPETVQKSLKFAIFCHGLKDFDNMLIAFSKLDWESMRSLVKMFLYYREREFWYENFPFLHALY